MKSLANAVDADEIFARLARLRPDSARRWGKMNAGEMLCHMADAARGVLGERPLDDRQTLLSRSIIKWIALWLPVPWPKGVPTGKAIDPLREGTRPGDFERDREAVIAEHRRFIERASNMPAEHPFFGPLSPRDWLRWGYLHADHHLRQFGL